ncbi:NAD(P)H-dependent oxidoreductase [Promicromonospora iranensis]|uniref:NAD(P)H-dependent oxidoreductase n=1 Tax=Promicromonospora iranensis TaxID=1105144 RepID=UPI0023A9742A|nr:NAD(P)H-dependent oxidoreductase [Promicromonospora iranensis]
MYALVVTAHPSPRSLTAELARVAGAALDGSGWSVEESDLYAMGWDPAVRLEDFGDVVDGGETVTLRSRRAYDVGALAPEIVTEQDKVRRADLLVLLFPMWWHGMPAILKGWFDRVFVNGFAFGLQDDAGLPRKYGDGGLVGRRMLTVVTAGDRGSSFEPRGQNGDLEHLLFPLLHGTAWYTGMAPLRPHLVSGVDRPGWDGFDQEADRLRERIAGLRAERPIPYRALSDGDYGRDRRLRPDVLPGESGLGVHECVDGHRLAGAGVVDLNRG